MVMVASGTEMFCACCAVLRSSSETISSLECVAMCAESTAAEGRRAQHIGHAAASVVAPATASASVAEEDMPRFNLFLVGHRGRLEARAASEAARESYEWSVDVEAIGKGNPRHFLSPYFTTFLPTGL